MALTATFAPPEISAGTGSPEGVVTGVVGAIWRRTNGGAGTTLYVKESGSGNTGWVAYGPSSGSSSFPVLHATGGDDSTAFAAAITALPATGGTILLPDALYKIGSVTIPAGGKTVTLVGGGINSTTIKQFNAAIGTGLVQMFDVTAGATFRLRDLTIDGTTVLSGVGIIRLILQNAGTLGLLDCQRVRFTKFSYGIWSEDQYQILRDCIFDGGDGGGGMGGIYANGLLANYAGSDGRCIMENCLYTDCGVTGTGQHHSTYIYSGISVIAHGNVYTRLWGDGYHCHHNDDRLIGARTIGVESKYTDCYVGGGLGGGSINGFAVCKEIILTLKNVTVESVDIPFYLEQNCRLVMTTCVIGGTAGTAVFNWEDTGIEVWADDCTFNSTATYHFYLFNSSGKLILLNGRYTGAVSYDVQVAASLTGCEVTIDGVNVHAGATAGVIRTGSGARVSVGRGFRALGTYSDAVIRNSAASTLAILELIDGDYLAATGTKLLLSATPGTLRIRNNPGLVTENGGVFSSTPGPVSTLNIAHGLFFTPTIMQVEPSNTNARGAPLYSVTADATNVIISFASNLTAATVYAWNWLARYQP